MQTRVQISAVIPTYNRAAWVGRAVDSVLGQEYPPAEIIVVDDGSADDTRGIVARYAGRVRYLYQANAGASAARNRGVREAGGEWIAFLDSDDCWLPSHLRRLAEAIEATRGEAALYFADLEVASPQGAVSLWEQCGMALAGEREFRQDAGDWALMRIQPMMLQASVISRKAYLQLGGLWESLPTREDTLLFFKLALLYPACAVAGCGAIMNADGSGRLTELFDQSSAVFCQATISLYRELLASLKSVGRERRQFFTDNLAGAYCARARVAVRQREYGRAAGDLARACSVSPFRVGREIVGWMKRHGLRTGSNRPAGAVSSRRAGLEGARAGRGRNTSDMADHS